METITVKLSNYEALQERVKELTIENRELSEQLDKRLVVHKQGLMGYRIYANDTALVEIGKEMQRLIDKNTALEEKLQHQVYSRKKARFRLFN